MRLSSYTQFLRIVFVYFAVIAVAWAGSTYADFLHDLAKRESGLDPRQVNGGGFAGLFQMGEAAMIDAGYYKPDGSAKNDWKGAFTGKNGINSLTDFINNPDAQVRAIADYEAIQWRVIQNLGLSNYIGQTIKGVQITQSGLIAGAHLVGYGGLRKYLVSNGLDDRVDGNGTHISAYIQQFGGYSVGGSIPSFADVKAAAGNSGLPISNNPVVQPPIGGFGNGGGVSFPPTPPLSNQTPDDAFFTNTGYHFNDVNRSIKEFLAASLFLWLVWTVIGTWKVFDAGRMTIFQLKYEMIRALIVILIGIMLIS